MSFLRSAIQTPKQFLINPDSDSYGYKFAELPILLSSQVGFTAYCVDWHTQNTLSIGLGQVGDLVTWNGSFWEPENRRLNVQVFDVVGSFNWIRPNKMYSYLAYVISGGPGGGSGRKGAAATVRSGGSGGSSSPIFEFFGYAHLLFPDQATIPVVVGDGGLGGAAVTANSTNGNPGLTGGVSSFGWFRGQGGTPGNGGSTSAAAVPGVTGSYPIYNSTASSAGGVGSPTAALTTVTVGNPTSFAASPGGSAGGISAANFGQFGGSSGRVGNASPGLTTPLVATNTPAVLSADGVNGPDSTGVLFPFFSGTGGSGGSSADPANTASNSGKGGNGGKFGAAGGASGAATDGTGTVPAGGKGGQGLVVVVSEY